METRKIAIIGDGAVGSSIAYTLMLGHAVNEIVIVDVNQDKAEGDALDMADGMSFLSVPKVIHAAGYEGCKDASVVIITAGAAQKPGETRLDLLHKNAAIFTSITDSLKPYLNEKSIVLVVSNPVDILTYFVYKKLGLPSSRVFGSGTVLDTSRLKTAIANDTHIDPRSIHTMVVGEHGDSEVAVWSATSVGGLSLTNYCAKCGKCAGHNMAQLNALHEQVKNAAYEIIQKKGATYYAVALAVSRIVSAILNDENSVLTVSTYLTSEFGGLLQDVYLSLPSVVNAQGVEKVLRPEYSEGEKGAIIASGLALKQKLTDLPL
jgi:L-lactate dehydrogenase